MYKNAHDKIVYKKKKKIVPNNNCKGKVNYDT